MQLRSGWCHCMSNTYGTWLPGDPRGFRTRGHREHVEGDYKSPPKEDYSARHAAVQDRLKQPPVILSAEARGVVLESVVDSLKRYGAEPLVVAVSAMHMHVLARFPEKPTFGERGLPKTSAVDDPVRHIMGLGKQWSAKTVVAHNLVQPGHVWARKGKIVRVRDRAHQLNVFRYILKHAQESAAVWSFREMENEKPTP